MMQTLPTPFRFPGNRTGVLLIHGFAGTLEDMRPLGETLAAQGWTVHGLWLAGHGTSEADLATKAASDWVISLRQGLAGLRALTDRIIIVGDSFGGNLALYAALVGAPVAGVVALNTPVVFRRDLLTRALLPILIRLAPMHRKRWIGDEAAHRAKLDYVAVPLRAYAEVIGFIDRHTKRELEGVVCPLLIVQSKKDFEVDPGSAYFLYEHAGSRDRELLWIRERVHHVLLSSRGPEITQRIINFIRHLPGVG